MAGDRKGLKAMMRIARGLVGSVIVIASLTGSALAQTYPPDGETIEVSDSIVVPCESITVTGANYTPGSTIDIVFNGVVIGTATVAADGTFSATVAIPCDTAPGTYVLSAGDATSQITVVSEGVVVDGGPGTGADVSAALIVMVGLLVLGVVAIWATRRRRSTEKVGTPA